jgi:hypothetical protein
VRVNPTITVTVDRRARRRPSVRGHLVPREWSALRWIAEQDVVRTDVVAHVLGGPEPLAADPTRRVVDRWRSAGLIERERLLAAGPAVCWLTSSGLRLVGARQRPRIPTVGRLDHLHAVSLVRLGVERRGGRAWMSERALLGERNRADEHVADGRYVAPNGAVTAVEVELTVKAARRLRDIVDDLTIEYAAVLYVVRGTPVRRAVERAVDTLGEQQRVAVVDLTQFQLDATR